MRTELHCNKGCVVNAAGPDEEKLFRDVVNSLLPDLPYMPEVGERIVVHGKHGTCEATVGERVMHLWDKGSTDVNEFDGRIWCELFIVKIRITHRTENI